MSSGRGLSAKDEGRAAAAVIDRSVKGMSREASRVSRGQRTTVLAGGMQQAGSSLGRGQAALGKDKQPRHKSLERQLR